MYQTIVCKLLHVENTKIKKNFFLLFIFSIPFFYIDNVFTMVLTLCIAHRFFTLL
nr:hypothetical protein [Microctonus hyperodae filamentous virus]